MKNKVLDFFFQTFLFSIGGAICAFAVNAILIPNNFLSNGLTGVSLIIYYLKPIVSVAIIYFIINIPVFFLGWYFINLRFVLYTLWGMIIYSILLFFMHFNVQINDKLLAAIISGVLTGLGVAIMLKSRGSAGGSEIISIILHKLFNITLGTGIIIINSLIMLVSLFLFPFENVLYTLVFIVVSAKTTDAVFHGLSQRETVLIISDKWKEILEALTNELRLSVTVIEGKGGYEGFDKKILYSVINRSRVYQLKRVALEKDPNVFITIMEASDVTNVKVGNQPNW